jgi:hypothetical protein
MLRHAPRRSSAAPRPRRRLRLALVIALLGQPAAWAALAPPQRQALIELYQSTQGPAWRHRDNWLVGDPCSNHWHGVGCSPDGQVVRSLSLPGNHLQGRLPESFSALNTLETVDLRGNMGLSGKLPPFASPALTPAEPELQPVQRPHPRLSHLVRLQTLVLSNNLLTGPLPELSGLPALQTLRLNHNQLSGPLPSLTQLSALQSIDLSFNHFEGHLPEFAGLSQLASFQGDWNRFEGPLPSPSGLLHLHTLQLSGNQLSGELPPLRNLPALAQLALDRNRFSGPLPPLNDLSALSQLNLAYNQFTGPLPELSRLRRLKLQVEGNQLSGALPERPPQLSHAVPEPVHRCRPFDKRAQPVGRRRAPAVASLSGLARGQRPRPCLCPLPRTPAEGEAARPLQLQLRPDPCTANLLRKPRLAAPGKVLRPLARSGRPAGLERLGDGRQRLAGLRDHGADLALSWLSQSPRPPSTAPEGRRPIRSPGCTAMRPALGHHPFRPRPSWPPS